MVSRLFSRQLPIEQEHLVCHRAAQDPELLLVEYSFLLYSVEPYFEHFTELALNHFSFSFHANTLARELPTVPRGSHDRY